MLRRLAQRRSALGNAIVLKAIARLRENPASGARVCLNFSQYTNRLKFLLPSWIFANVSVKFDIWRAIIEQLRGSTSRDR